MKNLNYILDDVWETMSKKCHLEIFGIEIENLVDNHVCDQVQWKFVVPIISKFSEKYLDRQFMNKNKVLNQIWNQIRCQIRIQLFDQTRIHIWSQVDNQVWVNVDNQVWVNVDNHVLNQILNPILNQAWSIFHQKFPFTHQTFVVNQILLTIWTIHYQILLMQINNHFYNQVWSNILNQIWNQAKFWTVIREFNQVKNQVDSQLESQIFNRK